MLVRVGNVINWRSLKQSQKFSDLRAWRCERTRLLLLLAISTFLRKPYSGEQFTSLKSFAISTFLRELFTSEPITFYPGKYSQRLVILRAKRSLRSQALYFLYLSHPPETEKEGKRSYDRTKLPAGRRLLFPLLHEEATDDEELMFSGIWPTLVLNVSKQRQLTPTSNY